MKLITLLDPTLPLPWTDLRSDGRGTTAWVRHLADNAAFTTDLVLPIGRMIEVYMNAVDAFTLRKNQIVIHTDGDKMSLHFVAYSVMDDTAMLAKGSDFILRLNPANKISPAAVYAQLFHLWKHMSISRNTIEALVNETEIAPVTEREEVLAEEALAIMVDAQNLVRRAALRREEAREVLAMISSSGTPHA